MFQSKNEHKFWQFYLEQLLSSKKIKQRFVHQSKPESTLQSVRLVFPKHGIWNDVFCAKLSTSPCHFPEIHTTFQSNVSFLWSPLVECLCILPSFVFVSLLQRVLLYSHIGARYNKKYAGEACPTQGKTIVHFQEHLLGGILQHHQKIR